MKGKILLLALTVPATVIQNAQAQSARVLHPNQTIVHAPNPLKNYHGQNNILSKGTSTEMSRMTEYVDYYNDGAIFQLNDSTTCWYSGTRGGDLNHQLKYDHATTNWYSGGVAYSGYNYLQSFDAMDNLTNSIWQYWDSASGWVNYNQDVYTYNSMNMITSAITQYWDGYSTWVNYSKDAYSYNPDMTLALDRYFIWDGTAMAFVASAEGTYFYDLSGNLIQEVDYSYDATGGTWMNSEKYDYTYDASGNLASETISYWDPSTFTWSKGIMYSYTYDASGDNLTELVQIWTGSSWENYQLFSYSSFTSAKNPLAGIYQDWNTTTNAWENLQKYTYAYNSFDQLTNYIGESWNAGGFWEYAAGDPNSKYYYETYSLSVNNLTSKGGEADIYPVPAENNLTIDLKWDNAQAFNVCIFDLSGRIVRQWDVPSTDQYHSSLSVNNFAAGTYIIKISGANGQITKQLVVAH